MPASRPWDALAPGERRRAWWEASAARLPVLAARGGADGPTVVLTGGVHGDEYEGPAAIQALFARLDPARLRGRLLGVPVVNVAAWAARSRVTPLDGVDLNRIFPGAAGRSPSAALAEALFGGLVRECDLLVDLHSGGAALEHLPLIGWYAGSTGPDERLARGFDAALHPWVIPDVPGVLSYEAHRAGKIAVAAEWGGGARLDLTGVAAYQRGLRRVLQGMEMLPRDDATHDARPPVAGDYLQTETGGLFSPVVTLGERVAQGQMLGVVRDELGLTVAEVRSPRDGVVAGLPHRALLHAGDRVAYVG